MVTDIFREFELTVPLESKHAQTKRISFKLHFQTLKGEPNFFKQRVERNIYSKSIMIF